jgi:hypothetical protein
MFFWDMEVAEKNSLCELRVDFPTLWTKGLFVDTSTCR